jgi:hypothetical protein
MSSLDSNTESHEALASPMHQPFYTLLENLAPHIPISDELLNANPQKRAKQIMRAAGLKAGAMSAGLALPPGPIGMLTVINAPKFYQESAKA